MISLSQKGFYLGCHTLDVEITTHEILHSMDHCNSASMTFKLDISKDYDKVLWDFLLKVLRKFGFNQSVIKTIRECISMVRYFLLVNGVPHGSFEARRGIRHSDPLSSYLFIMVVDVLSRNVACMLSEGSIKGAKLTTTLDPVVIQ